MAASFSSIGSYTESFSPSFQSKISGSVLKASGNSASSGEITSFVENGNLSSTLGSAFSTKEAFTSNLGSDFISQFDLSSPEGWTFITAPEDISWDIANQANRVDIFGTNNPPVIAGSRGMRDITLSNSLVEGFLRNVTVEGKVAALENLLNYKLNPSDGFVSVPVYQLWANEKSYGGPNAYYIIKDVRVRETMRDIKGYATRAYVDISLMQVPAYQVNSGRDQASTVTAGGNVRVNPVAPGGNSQANNAGKNGAGVAGSNKNGGSTSPGAKPASGASAGGNAAPVKALDLNKPQQIVPRSGSSNP